MNRKILSFVTDDFYLIHGIRNACSDEILIQWESWNAFLFSQDSYNSRVVLDFYSLLDRRLTGNLTSALFNKKQSNGLRYCLLAPNEMYACFYSSYSASEFVLSRDMSVDYFVTLLKLFIKGESASRKTFSSNLTLREREVLYSLLRGCSLRTIALDMQLSYKTVANHKVLAFKKIGCNSVQQLYKIIAPISGLIDCG